MRSPVGWPAPSSIRSLQPGVREIARTKARSSRAFPGGCTLTSAVLLEVRSADRRFPATYREDLSMTHPEATVSDADGGAPAQAGRPNELLALSALAFEELRGFPGALRDMHLG